MAYSNAPADKLFNLLPAYVREEDARNGGPLKALLNVIQQASDDIEDDIRQLHANAFIETCEPWVVPYIGELIGNERLASTEAEATPNAARDIFPDLRGPRLEPLSALRTRADVAKTIYYRRRKGTLPMLEELARDITGWPAHAVEFFERLIWTQCIRNRLRMETVTPDVRRVETCGRLGTAFDGFSHTIDVRPPPAPRVGTTSATSASSSGGSAPILSKRSRRGGSETSAITSPRSATRHRSFPPAGARRPRPSLPRNWMCRSRSVRHGFTRTSQTPRRWSRRPRTVSSTDRSIPRRAKRSPPTRASSSLWTASRFRPRRYTAPTCQRGGSRPALSS
ncbi:hypothetical protein [Sinorhizobium sp. BG8]|uniref:hypothetical protein n=1 Tax=Sinorhizobium sp. BG8 TaxID=2613773 RepID=UPI001FF0080B|nr:hypothetical protein [Sinorhizobium sp. BG8]